MNTYFTGGGRKARISLEAQLETGTKLRNPLAHLVFKSLTNIDEERNMKMDKENKQAIDAVTIDMTKDEAINKFMNIRQNINRSIRLIELDAPLVILNNEIRMIQRRALLAGAYYEECLEMRRETFLKAETN